MVELSNVEKEILEEIAEARDNIRKQKGVFPSGLDKDELITKVLRASKYSKYFTDMENATELAEKSSLLLNKATVSAMFDIAYTGSKKTGTEMQEEAEEVGAKLGIIKHELAKRLTTELDTFLSEYPSMKIAKKLVIVADDLRSISDLIMDVTTFEPVFRYRFIIDLKIFVS